MALSDVIKNAKLLQKPEKLKVVDLLKEQELIKAKYFIETEQGFIVEVSEGQDTPYLSEQICQHYDEVYKALKRYMEIEDMLNASYAKTYIEVLGYRFTVATGLNLLRDVEQVKRDPFSGKLAISTHPLGIFLSMCSVPCKFNYSFQPRTYVDPLGFKEDTIIEDVCYKIEEFLIQLKYAIEKSNNETEV